MRVIIGVLIVVCAACGGASPLGEDDLATVRESGELDAYSDDQLSSVAVALCEAFEEDEPDPEAIGDAWSQAGIEEVGTDEILASLDLLEAACPDLVTPALAADNEPISISFVLTGEEGEEYTYSNTGGCQGEGGYGDIREGMLFNLTDEGGEVLGVARMDTSAETSLGCEVSGRFAVTFGELDDDTLYLVGDRAGQRGELAYTGSELKQQGGIELSLGE